MNPKVIILGGGIAGLSAAHELVERNFDVEVHELLSIPGGKARSFGLPGSGIDGRKDLPGEHGFRFFPRFYRHVTDTMARIPYGPGNGLVIDNLVDTTRCQLNRYGRHPIDVIARSPRTFSDVRAATTDLSHFLNGDLDLTHDDLRFFGAKVWQIVTSCRERRNEQYEKIDWWDFISAEDRSPAYQKLLGHGITRSLVAAKARSASTKTIGDIFVQLLFDIITPGPSTDRVLNGPTNDVWIEPWLRYLRSRGVGYHLGSKAVAVSFDGQRIRSATVSQGGRTVTVEGDYFVLALPVEDVVGLLTPEMIRADPGLESLFTLDNITEWMNGIQIYLKEDVPLTHGHCIYVDSPWALTSISQAQFWQNVSLSQYGDGTVKGILSVDISEWEEPGLNGKTAKDCTPEEIKAEVWEQIKRSVNYGDVVKLRDEQLHGFSLDPSLSRHQGTTANEEPLLVNLVDTWRLRPEAASKIPNLFLAADYVRTYTDLATMEAANEAARRAVNAILDATGSDAARCNVWNLHEPEIFEPWRELDLIRFTQGLPWDDTLVRLGLSVHELVEKSIMALEQGSAEGGLTRAYQTDSPLPWQAALSMIDREAEPGSTSDLRREATALVERVVRLFAMRLAEAQTRQGVPPATGHGDASGGRVEIIPN
ncbi:NAD-binding domain and a Fe-S cluster-containing protein [Variovorax sp. HW608]|uniref:hydroxysqualene dehydroxylase n=1 Tax=Variovorax sp. HW608 TaxID=1034889 RepID=UPI00081F976B|nr:FAD-dependent oxidoreductase [Variovorax sp. HW608]SCK46390.1 NAD-binding domain and a Fe-S cluster-containing protein [Variovorax sp. HW608]